MKDEDEAAVRSVFDDHSTGGGVGGGSYIHENLVLKGLRELGLTPHDEDLDTLLETCDGLVDYGKFRAMYLRLLDEVVTPEQIRLAVQAFDPLRTGYIDTATFKDNMMLLGGSVTPAELAGLLGSLDKTRPDGKVSVDLLSDFIIQRHKDATVPCVIDPVDRSPPEPDEVSFAREQITSLRNLRHDDAAQRRKNLPSRTADVAELSQEWLRASHVHFLSYEGSGDGADRLLEISDALQDLDPTHCEALGFTPVRFKRADNASSATRLMLSQSDFSVADVRRLVSEALSLSINNMVLTVRLQQNVYSVPGQPLERGGGSFLSQLLALYTQMTGDDSPKDLPEVVVYRQPDIVQHREHFLCSPIDETLLQNALSSRSNVVLRRVVGSQEGHCTEGSYMLFADRREWPGFCRNPGRHFTSSKSQGGAGGGGDAPSRYSVEVRIAKLQIARASSKPVLVLKVASTPASHTQAFPFRCGVIIDTAQWGLTTTGQPLALYQWKADGPQLWSGFSCCSTPVMMENHGSSIQKVIVEFHQDGLYYISDAEIELLLDEANLDGRINKKYEVDGKAKLSGGRQYIRPWGWTRKGILMRPWKIDATPTNAYHGSELEMTEWMFAPRKKGLKKTSSDRTSHRNVERGRVEWRPADTPSNEWETWADGGKTSEVIFSSLSLQFSVFRPFFQYYSLMSSCDIPEISARGELTEWVSVPQVIPNQPIVRLATTVYVDTGRISDMDHPFSHVLRTVDLDFKGGTEMDTRCPVGRCRPVGLLLKRFPEAPERKLCQSLAKWTEATVDFGLTDGSNVMVRDGTDDPWVRGVVESTTHGAVESLNVRTAGPGGRGSAPARPFVYIRPDFDRPDGATAAAPTSWPQRVSHRAPPAASWRDPHRSVSPPHSHSHSEHHHHHHYHPQQGGGGGDTTPPPAVSSPPWHSRTPQTLPQPDSGQGMPLLGGVSRVESREIPDSGYPERSHHHPRSSLQAGASGPSAASGQGGMRDGYDGAAGAGGGGGSGPAAAQPPPPAAALPAATDVTEGDGVEELEDSVVIRDGSASGNPGLTDYTASPTGGVRDESPSPGGGGGGGGSVGEATEMSGSASRAPYGGDDQERGLTPQSQKPPPKKAPEADKKKDGCCTVQ